MNIDKYTNLQRNVATKLSDEFNARQEHLKENGRFLIEKMRTGKYAPSIRNRLITMVKKHDALEDKQGQFLSIDGVRPLVDKIIAVEGEGWTFVVEQVMGELVSHLESTVLAKQTIETDDIEETFASIASGMQSEVDSRGLLNGNEFIVTHDDESVSYKFTLSTGQVMAATWDGDILKQASFNEGFKLSMASYCSKLSVKQYIETRKARCYLRASTVGQDASRAKELLSSFVMGKGFELSDDDFYIENISGTKMVRPELERLIENSNTGDLIVVEKLDRLSRLPDSEWRTLKGRIEALGLFIVIYDQATTHQVMNDDFDPDADTMMRLLTTFMMDLAASQAREDYETRRARAAQGVARAKERDLNRPLEERAYKGRQANTKRNDKISQLLSVGKDWREIVKEVGCSRSTVFRVQNSMSCVA